MRLYQRPVDFSVSGLCLSSLPLHACAAPRDTYRQYRMSAGGRAFSALVLLQVFTLEVEDIEQTPAPGKSRCPSKKVFFEFLKKQ